MTRIRMAALVLLVAAIAGLVCFSGCARGKQRPLNVALITWVGYAPLYVAQEKGFFAEEGLKVNITKMEDTGARHAALTTDQIQVAINTVDAFASGAAEGVDAVAFLKTDDSFGGDGIVAAKEITSVAQLKGKTVAYPKGLPGHFFLLYFLDKHGLTSSDITSRTMEAGDAGAAFIAKKVDAAVTWEPWLTKAGESEHGHIVTTTKDAPGLIVDILVANRKTANTRMGDLRKLCRAWFKAIDYVEAHPDESYAIMGKSLGLSKDDFEGMVAGIKFSDYEDNLQFFGIKPAGKSKFAEVFDAAGRLWQREKVIKKALKGSDFQNTTVLKNLQSE